MTARRLWIVDGHNVIFAVPTLQRLQISGRREEARARLAEALEQFSIARGERVLVVFDGARVSGPTGGDRRPLLEIVYAPPGEGAADDRIVRAARTGSERGLAITVVTNDVATLANRLPRGVRHVRVEPFWLTHIEPRPEGSDGDGDGRRTVRDVSDLEQEMLALAASEEPVFRAAAPDAPAGGRAARAKPDPVAAKRERGRLRQERRLKRIVVRRHRR